ncbi:MAG TPA: helix-turn-helix domain-containing protein [Bryobacteraceae bacterium]|nr:helix-turn-helix domain-containing protein [Bryobacteraceae bacterium]
MKAKPRIMKKGSVVSGRSPSGSLDQLRALAHPLRLRMLELFAEGPRTTKQVAQQLGEPPTKLYHHANALERVGLLTLAKTRQNRGATEKWYEAASNTISGRQPSRSRPMQQAISGLATVALEQARREVQLALPRPRGGRPLVVRITTTANQRRIAQIRKRLLQVLQELSDQKGKAKRAGGRDAKRWTLTIAFVPAESGEPAS